ncbi:MAG: hypothetical protein G01um101416_566 [Microgenomates group bacterium Gr01-1014_16]|nr:MAG: hypothetical protein G01um101416_566 [Microgenomates group bacterium Gr01-1014_16]
MGEHSFLPGKGSRNIREGSLGYVDVGRILGFPEAEASAVILDNRKIRRGNDPTDISGSYGSWIDATGKLNAVVYLGRSGLQGTPDPRQTTDSWRLDEEQVERLNNILNERTSDKSEK